MRRLIESTLLSACALSLAAVTGCGKEVLVKVPVDKPIIVEKYRPLPEEMLVVPQITYPKERSVSEAVRALNFNTPQLEQCIVNLKKIVDLQGYTVP